MMLLVYDFTHIFLSLMPSVTADASAVFEYQGL